MQTIHYMIELTSAGMEKAALERKEANNVASCMIGVWCRGSSGGSGPEVCGRTNQSYQPLLNVWKPNTTLLEPIILK